MAQIERIEAQKGEFVSIAVEWLVKSINDFIASDGECILGLSGGA
jgi:6-phosphogluconolactonase/glucosamine-6-phosphate isomerase/deaminase